MGTKKKPAFPQTKDGVTDWEQVFESPEDGLIALIGSASSVEGLRQCTLLVIRKLFTRDNDQLEVARLTRQLDALIIQQGDLAPIEQLSQAVIGLLRQIKDERIRFAREYLASKHKRRRPASPGERFAKTVYGLINHPKFTLITSSLVLMLFLMVAVVLFFEFTNVSEEKSIASEETGEKAPQAETAPPTAQEKPIPEPKEPPRLQKQLEMPPAIVFQRMFLPRRSRSSRPAGMVLPVIVFSNPEDLSAICKLKPFILDALNSQFGKGMGQKQGLNKAALMRIGQSITNRLNENAGRTLVSSPAFSLRRFVMD